MILYFKKVVGIEGVKHVSERENDRPWRHDWLGKVTPPPWKRRFFSLAFWLTMEVVESPIHRKTVTPCD